MNRKQTHTDQISCFHRNHSNDYKQPCIQNSFKRTETYCSTEGIRSQQEKYLFEMFKKNKYPRNFVRRTVQAMNKETNRTPQSNRRIILPYIKNVSESTVRSLQLQGIALAYKPSQTITKLRVKAKEHLKTGKRINVHKVKCNTTTSAISVNPGEKWSLERTSTN